MTSASLERLVGRLRFEAEARQPDGLTDADLLERFRLGGDAAAFEAIVRRYGAGVLGACRKVLGSEADADDAFQATFLALLRSARTIRRGQALGGWLYGVAHRVALKALAGAARRQRAERNRGPAGEECPDLSWREACGILHEELDRLPDTYRLPLLLCYLEGKSRDEAARELGCKADVLRGRLERGRDRLRHRLTRRGVSLSAGLLTSVAAPPAPDVPPEGLLRATLEVVTTGQVPASVSALLRGLASPAGLGKFKLLAVAVLAVVLISGDTGVRTHGAPPALRGAAPAPGRGRPREGEGNRRGERPRPGPRRQAGGRGQTLPARHEADEARTGRHGGRRREVQSRREE